MVWTADICTPIETNCVVLYFRDLCLDRNAFPKQVTGTVLLNNVPEGHELSDDAGAFFINYPLVQSIKSLTTVIVDADGNEVVEADLPEDADLSDYCVYTAIKTCPLPANKDSDYDPDDPDSVSAALNVDNTYYTINVKIGTQAFSYDFVLDAAVTYDEFCGCVPIRQVAVGDAFPPADVEPGDPFTQAVCDSLASYEDGGELPFDGTVKIVGVDPDGVCKLYTVSETCNLETMQHIADALT